MKGHYLKMYPEKIPRKKCTFHQTNSYRTTILLSNYCLNEKFYARESIPDICVTAVKLLISNT